MGGTEEVRSEVGVAEVRFGVVVVGGMEVRFWGEMTVVVVVVITGGDVLDGGTEDVRRVLGLPFCVRRGDLGTEDVKGMDRGIVVPGGFEGWTSFCVVGCITTGAAVTAVAVVAVATDVGADFVTDAIGSEIPFSLTTGSQALTKAFSLNPSRPVSVPSPLTCLPPVHSFPSLFGVPLSRSVRSSTASE